MTDAIYFEDSSDQAHRGVVTLELRGKSKASDTPGGVNEEATSNPAACQLEHSVEADVGPSFAWNWQTDVKNWDDPPARFQLDGPFASGSSGTTVLPGQAPLHWRIRDVQPGRSFVDAVADRRTRECIKYYGKKTRPSTRIAARVLSADLGEDWRAPGMGRRALG
jgi:hypothetical protein